jgi:hypothetical protein
VDVLQQQDVPCKQVAPVVVQHSLLAHVVMLRLLVLLYVHVVHWLQLAFFPILTSLLVVAS